MLLVAIRGGTFFHSYFFFYTDLINAAIALSVVSINQGKNFKPKNYPMHLPKTAKILYSTNTTTTISMIYILLACYFYSFSFVCTNYQTVVQYIQIFQRRETERIEKKNSRKTTGGFRKSSKMVLLYQSFFAHPAMA